MSRRIRKIGLAAAVAVLMAGHAGAADLIIGARATPTIDPHFLYS